MNKLAALALVFAAMLSVSGAGAQERPQRVRTATICVDSAGRAEAPTCRVPATRIQRKEDLCLCGVGDKVEAPICPPGVRPPPESRELEAARRKAIDAGGLIGATFEDKPICIRG
jgi:hypothetical protein